jgi:1-acyl-sn-glycerol-3-phosphate acyltransferase
MNIYKRTIHLLRIATTLMLMSMGALVMLCIAIVTLFQLRQIYSERIATPLGRIALRLWGIRVRVHHLAPFPDGQVVYVSNHTSTIDIFVLIALSLPNTRFFLSGFLRKLLPLGLIGYLIGIFWTVPQDYPKRRQEIFRRADFILRRTGESVYLSPEGERVTTGEIGHFNKGAFHLATSLQAPIVPIFIAIPSSIDPGRGLNASAGVVDVYVHNAISTAEWNIEDVVTHKETMRQRFVEWNSVYRIGNLV